MATSATVAAFILQILMEPLSTQAAETPASQSLPTDFNTLPYGSPHISNDALRTPIVSPSTTFILPVAAEQEPDKATTAQQSLLPPSQLPLLDSQHSSNIFIDSIQSTFKPAQQEPSTSIATSPNWSANQPSATPIVAHSPSRPSQESAQPMSVEPASEPNVVGEDPAKATETMSNELFPKLKHHQPPPPEVNLGPKTPLFLGADSAPKFSQSAQPISVDPSQAAPETTSAVNNDVALTEMQEPQQMANSPSLESFQPMSIDPSEEATRTPSAVNDDVVLTETQESEQTADNPTPVHSTTLNISAPSSQEPRKRPAPARLPINERPSKRVKAEPPHTQPPALNNTVSNLFSPAENAFYLKLLEKLNPVNMKEWDAFARMYNSRKQADWQTRSAGSLRRKRSRMGLDGPQVVAKKLGVVGLEGPQVVAKKLGGMEKGGVSSAAAGKEKGVKAALESVPKVPKVKDVGPPTVPAPRTRPTRGTSAPHHSQPVEPSQPSSMLVGLNNSSTSRPLRSSSSLAPKPLQAQPLQAPPMHPTLKRPILAPQKPATSAPPSSTQPSTATPDAAKAKLSQVLTKLDQRLTSFEQTQRSTVAAIEKLSQVPPTPPSTYAATDVLAAISQLDTRLSKFEQRQVSILRSQEATRAELRKLKAVQYAILGALDDRVVLDELSPTMSWMGGLEEEEEGSVGMEEFEE
ncbi:hypothetical protein HDV05_000444 [Chytridiales sp. JEL 0842]|nr:hypothetical protein HDV05_000444 [Chytridiales sp. JEL 0842]